VVRLADKPAHRWWATNGAWYGGKGGPTTEVSEDDDEDIEVDGVAGYMGGIAHDGASSVGAMVG